jgi:hypothetical protein
MNVRLGVLVFIVPKCQSNGELMCDVLMCVSEVGSNRIEG